MNAPLDPTTDAAPTSSSPPPPPARRWQRWRERWQRTTARQRFTALVAATAVLLLARCATTPEPRRFDEIVAAGVPFHTGVPVVLWNDPGGYDAYQQKKRFTDEPEPDGKLRYGKVRTDLPTAIAERVAASGWSLADLRQVVHLFVLHFDVAGTSRQCFKILQDRRFLSVHFMLDTDGTIYQTLDLQEHAQHATYSNAVSIGVEIAHPGCYPQPLNADMRRWYEQDEQGWHMKFPQFLGETGVRTKDFVPRPDRPQIVSGPIHGKVYHQFDFTKEQYTALAHLCAAVSAAFPRVRLEAPRDENGVVVTTNLPREKLLAFDGIVGHYHVQANKQDPGPAMQWDRLLSEARAIAAHMAKR